MRGTLLRVERHGRGCHNAPSSACEWRAPALVSPAVSQAGEFLHSMTDPIRIPFSVLDLSPILEGGDAAQSFRNTLDLAKNVERFGYRRYWLAEHHNTQGVASAATSVLIAHVAGGTTTIRVGAGGIMLPNHAPLMIAEQFGTLESLFPGRIDLGLGRAPGTDPLTSRALRRTLSSDPEEFPNDVLELMEYFQPSDPRRAVRAIPGEGLNVPIWILGSSLFGAHLAAAFGLPYAFASHFAPEQMMEAIEAYRSRFQPSRFLERPYMMLGFNVYAADSDEQAQVLATSPQQAFVNKRTGRRSKLPPPRAGYVQSLVPPESEIVKQTLVCSAIGSPRTVHGQIQEFIERTQADELMLATQIFEHAARVRSYEIASQVRTGAI